MNLTKLDNGIKLLYREVPSQLSRLYLSFSRGAVNDVVELVPGATHMMEHMLFKAPREEELQFNNVIESLGCDSNAFTSYDGLGISVNGLNKDFLKAVNEVFEYTLNPEFGEEELKTEKEVVVQEIRNYLADNNYYYFTQVLPKSMAHGTPYEVPLYGDELTVRNLTPKVLGNIYAKWFFDTQDMIVSYSGPEKEKTIAHLLSDILGSRPHRKLPNNSAKNIKATPRTYHLDKDVAGQAFLTVFYSLDSMSIENLVLTELLSSYLTDGSSSMLFRELRQERGLVYHVGSESQHFGPNNPYFLIYTECSKPALEEVQKLISETLPSKILEELDEKAFDRVRTKYLLSLAREFESYGSYTVSSIEHLRLYGTSDKNASKLEVLEKVGTLDNLKTFYTKLIETQPYNCSMA